MGLFSFGAKEKEEQPRRAEPDTITTLALQKSLGDANLDYLFEAYAPEVWTYNKVGFRHARATRELCETIIKNQKTIAENQVTIEKNLQQVLSQILSRLDDISRRLDALEQSKEMAERTR